MMINLNASMDSVLNGMAGRPGQPPRPLTEGVSQGSVARRTLHAAAKRHPQKSVAPRPADHWHNMRRTRAGHYGHMPPQLDYGLGQSVGLVPIHNAQQLVTRPLLRYSSLRGVLTSSFSDDPAGNQKFGKTKAYQLHACIASQGILSTGMVSTAPERAHVSSMAGRQAQELPPGHTIPQYVSSPTDSMPPCLAIASCLLPPAHASCLPPLVSRLLRSCSVRWTYQARCPPVVPPLRSGYVATHLPTAFEADGSASHALSLLAAEPRCVCVLL